jgi:signal transduction histidine kinase
MKLDSIQSRLVAAAFVFIIGTSVAMGIIGLNLTTTFLKGRFHDHFRMLASYMASNAELGVLLRDAAMLERLAENMLAQEDVQAVTITGSSGHPLARVEREVKKEPTRHVTAPVMAARMDEESLVFSGSGEHEQAGTVTLTYSRQALEDLSRIMASRFLLISILLALVSAVVYWILSRSIVAPLNQVVEVARKVSRGDMEVRAGTGSLSETRTLASAFNEMLDALRRREAALEEARARMAKQEALAEVGKFSMMVAHEVKNPLAIIKGSLAILKKNNIARDTRSTMVLYLEEEVGRINRLMEDFLVFARPKEPEFQEVEINGLVREMTSKMDLMSSGQGPEVQFHIAASPCFLHCDPQLLERAVLNVMRNAFESATAAGRVDIETRSNERSWILTVRDTGAGIPAEHLDRIFEPFFTTRAKGTGLGLAMAKGIVEAHGGEIRGENRETGGARFVITLPLKAGKD